MPENTPQRGTSRRAVLIGAAATILTVGVGAAVAIPLRFGLVPPFVPPPGEVAIGRFPALDGSNDDAAAAIIDFLGHQRGHVQLEGSYVLDSVITVPPAVSRLTLASGTSLKVRGNHGALARNGKIVFRELTGFSMKQNSTRIQVKTPSEYSVGETLLLSGKDVVAGSNDRYGYMRRIQSIDGDSVTLDSPIPRSIMLSPRTSLVTLAPSLTIDGPGEISSVTQKETKSSLVRLFAADSPTVQGIDVHTSGGPGVALSHCRNALIDCTISDLLDDGKNYFGYGVSVSGSTSNSVIKGTISRVRHAVTTNAGPPIDGLGYAGEPENNTFEPQAADCTNKAVDTHRLGWNTTIIPHVTGGKGGVQVRADNTTVTGGTIENTNGPGIFISTVVKVAATVEGTHVSDLKNVQVGVMCNGPADLSNITITNPGGPGIQLSSNSTVATSTVAGTATVGIVVNGTDNVVSMLNIAPGIEVPSKRGPNAGTNQISVQRSAS